MTDTPAGEGRVEECQNSWSDGTCPKCGEYHYIIVRREPYIALQARLRVVEEERDRVQRKYDDAMEVLTRWGKVDAAVAIAEAQAEARRLREALENIMNYADDPPCESSLTGECDKGYHNDHGQAIVRARAALTSPHAGPKEGPQGFTRQDFDDVEFER